jgi:hypothetical protein
LNGSTYSYNYYNDTPLKYSIDKERPKTLAFTWGLNFGIHYQFRK